MTRHMNRATALMAVLLLLFVATACGEAASTTPSESDTGQAQPTATDPPTVPIPTLMPTPPGDGPPPPPGTPSPSIDPAIPFHMSREVDLGPPPTAAQHVGFAHLIVVGRVVEILPSIWTTPDGNRPANPFESVPDTYQIITPVVIELTQEPILKRPPPNVDTPIGEVKRGSRIVVGAFGGSVGPDSIATNNPSSHFEVDEEVIVMLRASGYSRSDRVGMYETKAGPAWAVSYKYTLTPDGKAIAEGPTGPVSRTASGFAQDLLAAARVAPTPGLFRTFDERYAGAMCLHRELRRREYARPVVAAARNQPGRTSSA